MNLKITLLALCLAIVHATTTCDQIKDAYKAFGSGQTCCGAPPKTLRTDINIYDHTKCILDFDISTLGKNSLDVVVLGTGSPLDGMARGQYSFAVYAGDMQFIVDAGYGSGVKGRAVSNFQMVVDHQKLTQILLTHFHSDHVADLPYHTNQYSSQNTERPMEIVGPSGVCDVVDGLNTMMARSQRSRALHHNKGRFDTNMIEYVNATCLEFEVPRSPTVIFDRDGLRITTFEVDHRPVYPAVGYRFEYMGRSAVFLGDSVYCKTAMEGIGAASDLVVAVLVDDDIAEQMSSLVANVREQGARVMEDIIEYHANPHSLARMIHEKEVQHWLITHIMPGAPGGGPPVASRDIVESNIIDKTLAILRNDMFWGQQALPNISVAQTLSRIHLPAASNSVEISKDSEIGTRACEVIDPGSVFEQFLEFNNTEKALIFAVSRGPFGFSVPEFISWMQKLGKTERPYSFVHSSSLTPGRAQSDAIMFNGVSTTVANLFEGRQANVSEPLDLNPYEALVFTFRSTSEGVAFQTALGASEWANVFDGTDTNVKGVPWPIRNPIIGSEMMFRRTVASEVGFVTLNDATAVPPDLSTRLHIRYVMERNAVLGTSLPDPLPMLWAIQPGGTRTFFIEFFSTLSEATEHLLALRNIGPSPDVNLPEGRPSHLASFIEKTLGFLPPPNDNAGQTLFYAIPVANLDGPL